MDGSVEKTTMRMHYGPYEFLVMSFGLCNGPSTFTMLMNLVFHDKLDKFLIIYIDGIFIYSKSVKEHARHLEYVMQKPKENDLYANRATNEFA
jgi:energy-coupling factor transporter ATP-binding protein EcfA2